jgi:hypothetical protein
MSHIDSEGEWLVALPERLKLVFLASLSHQLTIAGRNSYEVGTEMLKKPEQLRKVNEIQHRVSACMRELLSGHSSVSFQQSIAGWVLRQTDEEFRNLMSWAWRRAKEPVSNAA